MKILSLTKACGLVALAAVSSVASGRQMPCPPSDTTWEDWINGLALVNPEQYTGLRCLSTGSPTPGSFPSSIQAFSNLAYIMFLGNVPGLSTEIGLLPNLKFLVLISSGYQIGPRGPIPSELGNLPNLKALWSIDFFSAGTIPTTLGLLSDSLISLVLRRSELTGTIPTELSNLQNLAALILSENNLSGTLPHSILRQNMPDQNFDFDSLNDYVWDGDSPTDYSLGFQIPFGIGSLHVDDNQLTGTLPTQLGRLNWLKQMNLNSNSFSGTLPLELQSMSNLESVSISDNNLSGLIPPEIIRGWVSCHSFDFDGNPLLISSPCEVIECPTNGACVEAEEIRFGIMDFRCECGPAFVNEANPDTEEVPLEGTCIEAIPLEYIDVASTALEVKSQRPGEGHMVQFSLEKLVSNTRQEPVARYTNVQQEYDGNYATYRFSNLDSGSRYQVKAVILKEDGTPHEDYSAVVRANETNCNCVDIGDGDTSGRPRNVVVRQDSGYILFQFTDNSRCEDAFSFSRRLVDPDTNFPLEGENVFTPNYYYFGQSTCDETMNPGFQATDDLRESRLQVGATVSYAIRAVAKDYSFSSRSSNAATVYHQVLWEASIDGSVTLSRDAGFLPVENVLVEYQLRTSAGPAGEVIPMCSDNSDENVWCTTTTSEGGGFEIRLSSNHSALNNEQDYPLFLRFTKATGEIVHTFLCDEGVDDCSAPSYTVVFVKHLDLKKSVHVIDDTTVAFVGKVTVKGTEMPGAGALGCPVPFAEVCLMDHQNRNTLETQATCVLTDGEGVYRLPAVLGTRVSPQVNYFDHKFVAFSSNHSQQFEQGIRIEPGRTYEGYNLQDVTKANLAVEVAGGLCNHPLGEATVHLEITGCPWEGEDLIVPDGMYKAAFTTPAQTLSLQLTSIVGSDNVDRFGIVQDFRDSNKDTRTIDLTELDNEGTANETATPTGVAPERTADGMPDEESSEGSALEDEEEAESERQNLNHVRFQYDGQDELTIRLGFALNTTCYETEDDVSYHSVRTSEPFLVRILARQEFGYGIPFCTRFPENTTLTIQNFVGESDGDEEWVNSLSDRPDFPSIARTLRRCKPFCQEPLVHDSDGTNAHLDLALFAGRPNAFNDLTKPLFVSIDRSGVTRAANVAVLGDIAVAERASVPVPTHKPLLVLRDPPGGNSYAFYENVLTTMTVDIQNFQEYWGFDAGVTAGFGQVVDIDSCVGFGASMCKDVVMTGRSAGLSVEGGSDFITNFREDQSGAKFTTKWSYATSQDVWLAGKQSDTFLVPNINVKFMDVVTVFLDDFGCPQSKNELKFDLDSPDNQPAIAFLTRYDVENVELKNLQLLLDQEQEKIDSGDLDEDDLLKANFSREAFADAIRDWTVFLERHDEVSAMAGNGTLHAFKPSNWVQAFNTDPNSGDNHWSGMVPLALAKQADRLRQDGFTGDDSAEDEATLLNRINQIKFDGGGSSLRFELHSEKLEEHLRKVGNPRDNMRSRFRPGFAPGPGAPEQDTEVEVGSWVAEISITAAVHRDRDSHHNLQESSQESTTIGFVLGDDDSGDVFDIDVYLDPDFGTFVFHTVGGRSRCPVEEGTDAREKPTIRVKPHKMQLAMPEEPLLFEVELTNEGLDASSFQLYTDHRTNTGLIGHITNGDTLTVPQQYDRILAGETVTTTILLMRGEVGYDHSPFPLILRSACEGVRNIGDGNLVALLPDRVASTRVDLFNYADDEVGPRIRFAEPCPAIEWAADLADDESFLVNINSEIDSQDRLRVVIRNLEASQRSLADIVESPTGRLERVELRYRRVGSGVWAHAERAIAADEFVGREFIDFAQLEEDEFGYITSQWLLAGLGDGEYELEVRSICTPNGDSPADFNRFLSKRLHGVIDRSPPVLFGSPQPIVGELLPGQAVSFEFNEDILCGDVATFELRVTVAGLDTPFDNAETNNLLTVCQGRFISFQFRLWDFDELIGRNMHIQLSNVQDIHENVMEGTIDHYLQFSGTNLDLASTTFVLSAETDICNISKRSERRAYVFTPEQLLELQEYAIAYIGVEESRLTVSTAQCVRRYQADVTMTLSPPSSDDEGTAEDDVRRRHLSSGGRREKMANAVELFKKLHTTLMVDSSSRATATSFSFTNATLTKIIPSPHENSPLKSTSQQGPENDHDGNGMLLDKVSDLVTAQAELKFGLMMVGLTLSVLVLAILIVVMLSGGASGLFGSRVCRHAQVRHDFGSRDSEF